MDATGTLTSLIRQLWGEGEAGNGHGYCHNLNIVDGYVRLMGHEAQAARETRLQLLVWATSYRKL